MKVQTDITTWTVEKLLETLRENPNGKEKLLVPKYQRNLVWSKPQKKSFIESLKKGFPFGSLLLYQAGNDDGYTTYRLIDGLQRTSTLSEYNSKPTQYFDEEQIKPELVKGILEKLGREGGKAESEIRNLITNWVKSLTSFKEKDGYSQYGIAEAVIDHFERPFEEIREYRPLFSDFIADLENESNINEAKIPIIIYSGDEANLPVIFERLNSRGTQLNKYQIYAATWEGFTVDINNKEIINNIKKKYDSLIDEGFQVDMYDPETTSFEESDFNAFEYVFGLGKSLAERFPRLFDNSKDSDTADSIGFNLCTACLKKDIQKMPYLPHELVKIDLNRFYKTLVDATEHVEEALKPYISIKTNRTKSSRRNLFYHGELQIVSMIGKVFNSKYNEKLEVRESWNANKDQLLMNLSYYYLYDILGTFWRGSGDSKIRELVGDNSKYDRQLYKENWDLRLDEWFLEQLERGELKRVTNQPSDILFLNYIYAHKMTVFENNSANVEFEIEHLVSISSLKKLAKKEETRLPMSAVANVCLLQKELNRKKQNKSIYEYFDEFTNDGNVSDICLEEIESYAITKREDLDIVNDLTVENYKKFLEVRFEKLKNSFYKLNNIMSSSTAKV